MLSTAAAQEIRSFTAIPINTLHGDRLRLPSSSRMEKVQLNWTVLPEKNILRVEIERSQDNEHYKRVQSISQHFRSTDLLHFSCTDAFGNVNSDIFYYRLKIINKPFGFKMSPAQVVRINRSLTPTVIVADLAGTTDSYIK